MSLVFCLHKLGHGGYLEPSWGRATHMGLRACGFLDILNIRGCLMAGTKRVKTEQVDEVRELAPEQVTCIAALLEGCSDQEAGERAGVSRSSVQRWRRDALFVATLNAELQARWREQTARLRALGGEAMDVIAAALRSDDEKLRLATAWRVRDILAAEPPKGATTEQGVQHEWDGASLFTFTF